VLPETLEAVGKGGPLVLCALILVGIFYLALRFVPPFLVALHANATATNACATEIRGLRDVINTRADAHDRKDEDILLELRRVADRQSEIAGDVERQEGIALGAAVATGRHQAVTTERPEPDPYPTRGRLESRPTVEEPTPYPRTRRP